MSTPESIDFGGMLRAARERQGLTIKELAEITKISQSVLTALEANKVDQVPGGLFIRAFVRSYAAEVGLDPEHIVAVLLEAHPDQGYDAFVGRREESVGPFRDRKKLRPTGVAIGLLIISAIVVGLLLFLGFRGSTDADPDDDAAAVDDVVTETMSSSVEIRTPRQPVDGESVTASPSLVSGVVAEESLTVAVYPTAPCWVLLTIDGKRVFAGVMGAGERKVYEANSQITLNVGDAGAFSFSINQQPGRILGEPGEVVTVEIDRNNYRDFVRP